MASELSIIKKEENIQANGLKIKWKEEELYITLVEILLMRDNGNKTNYMVMVYYTIKHRYIFVKPFLGRLLTKSMDSGLNMKEILNKISNMDKGLYFSLMVSTIKAVFKVTYLKAVAILKPLTGLQ